MRRGESLHVQLVRHRVFRGEASRAPRRDGLLHRQHAGGLDDRLRQEARRIALVPRAIGMLPEQGGDAGEGAVEPRGVGIHEEFRRVVAMAVEGGPRAVRAEPIPRPGAEARDHPVVHVTGTSGERDTHHLVVARRIEHADLHPLGVPRRDGEGHTALDDRRPERRDHGHRRRPASAWSAR